MWKSNKEKCSKEPVGPVCSHCGIEITELSLIPKSKTVAVVLAVFFGFWSWIYTYGKDRIKFWSCLGLMIVIGVAWGATFRHPRHINLKDILFNKKVI